MLRAQMDAAEYKHILLVLIFVKLTSGTFGKQQNKIREMMSDLKSEYCITEQSALYAAELAERDYHTEDNVFRVLQEARWEALRAKPDRPIFRSMIDTTMTATENDNKTLRGMLHKQFRGCSNQHARPRICAAKRCRSLPQRCCRCTPARIC